MSIHLKNPSFAAIGECMLELSEAPDSGLPPKLQLGYGGDTLNTALYCARLGVEAHYVTALGEDARSEWLINEWRQEGLGVSHVARLPDREPGLYWITIDDKGERSFSYWRSESAARELLSDAKRVRGLSTDLTAFGMVYLSGITLSLFNAQGLDQLWALLRSLRDASVCIAFDGNYRPRAWASRKQAQGVFDMALRHSDIALPTFDDEQKLFGDKTPDHTLDRIHRCGVSEAVVKVGPEGCWISDNDTRAHIKTATVSRPVDTTAAGDSFNAGYLAGRLHKHTAAESARQGNRLAQIVIAHRGAIIPRSLMSNLDTLPRAASIQR